jgi:lysophospholipase L1-like esterase
MMRRYLMFTWLLVLPAFVEAQEQPELPRVLLIGDSISMGYTQPVQDLLKSEAHVLRIPANGGPTTRGLANIDRWIGDGNWDVIHFNWGIHDLKHMPGGLRQVEVRDYEKNLRKLVSRLKKTGAKLIWAATTPIPKGKLNPDRTFGDETEYNLVAAKVMQEEGVLINDLHSYVMPRFAELHKPRDLHFKPEGSDYLATRVAEVIQQNLPESPNEVSAEPKPNKD